AGVTRVLLQVGGAGCTGARSYAPDHSQWRHRAAASDSQAPPDQVTAPASQAQEPVGGRAQVDVKVITCDR
ncbi:hypothetical protein Q604_UNBC14801G0001, partial [human gut metagenome]